MTAPAAPPIRTVGNSAVAAVGILAGALGTLESVVSPTLPLLQRELGIDPAQGALLSIAMLITGALTAPIAGVLGDRHGGKRVMIWLMVVVTAGGLVSSLAPNLPVLLAGQALEGAMVGAMPLSFILMRKLLPADRSPVAIGVVSGFFVGGGMLGTLIAGPIAEGLSRRWMFAIPTMAIVAATVLVHRLLPGDQPSRTDARIDWPGMLLLSGIVLTFMAGLATAPDMGSQPLLLIGVVVLLAIFVTGWVAVERRTATPMFDLRLLARPAIWRSYVVTFATCVGAALSIYLVTQLFAVSGDGYGFGASPTDIGRYLLPAAAMAAISGPLGGLGVRRFGSTAVVAAGIVLMTAGLIGMALVHTEVWHLVVGKALISLANGACITALVIKTATSVDQGNTGTATSMVLVIRVLGFATGAQIGGAVLTAGTPAGSDIPAESAYVTALVIAGVVTTLSLLALRTMSKGARN
ncbi:MFS transporter [Paractinoplanes brasiliensis]|uniref:Putative MFS family arabinose efflux permease n=1 Tax=Paractinoplanes brasiliensis TaxID=52695 RepID=A0A4R6K3L7_9ACTN|nr:MFS transporter [Actinoplanes brasiliensis]TDO41815.1 putative MFS family arabinose efflux permease [Actinoplanes brasiliensis]GID29913.1 MFS transporter [Actinoplanes brasiliensis]